MLLLLEEIFEKKSIEVNSSGERMPLHSNTSKRQGLFLQEMFDIAKPNNSLEVGFAYGISTLFILEKHREANGQALAHITIEPDDYWGTSALHNITKAGLDKYLDVRRNYSDKILTQLFHENHRIQFAYVDTTKQFDIVMQDFYFINKILDVDGVIVLDDCGGTWPGIQRVARFINTLPNYKIVGRHNMVKISFEKRIFSYFLKSLINLLPYKNKVYPTIDFKTDEELQLNYACIAFQKCGDDLRKWDWDGKF